MADGAAEQDPFDEYLSQEQAAHVQRAAYAEPAEASPQMDANIALRQLVESGQRQEQLLGKVCSLLVGLDGKLGQLAASQERLEASMQQFASQGAAAGAAPAGVGAQRPSAQRGNLVQPPGKSSAGPSAPMGGASFTGAASAPSPEEQRLAAERLAAERLRIEEEGRRREEELARKREEDERRKREEAERLRLEEECRREEERKRKANLEKKTGSLMSNLISGSGSSSLFGDEEPKRGSKGGLFDD